jgi:O-antigen/teichoic acid export membrane protein
MTVPESGIDALPRLAGRVSWGLADQALSSLTNFVLGIAVARTVDPAGFGAFSLVFVAFLIGMNVARPLALDPLAVRYSGPADDRWRRAAAAATGLVLIVGLVGSLVCLPVVAFSEGITRQGFFALALTFPGLLVQDAWRFVFFSVARGRAAFLNDLAMTLILIPLIVALSSRPDPSVFAFVLAWGGAATMAAVVGRIQAGFWPQLRLAQSWLRENRDLSAPLVTQRAAWVGQGQVSVYTIAAVSSLATVGTLRGAELVLGPVSVVSQGVGLMAVPEGVRILARSVGALVSACRVLAVGLLAVTIVWAVLVLAIPESIGVQILGEMWPLARAILVPITIATAGYSLMTGALVGVLVLADARRYLRIGLAVSGVTLVAMTAGAAAEDAAGAAIGACVAMWTGAGLAWWQFGRSAREFRARTSRSAERPYATRVANLSPEGSGRSDEPVPPGTG